jgi:hypothetical protein
MFGRCAALGGHNVSRSSDPSASVNRNDRPSHPRQGFPESTVAVPRESTRHHSGESATLLVRRAETRHGSSSNASACSLNWRARTTPRSRRRTSPARLRERLEKRFAGWRGILHRQSPMPADRQEVAGWTAEVPPKQDADGTNYYELEGEGALAKLLGNLVPIMVASLMPTSWNHVVSWLKRVDALRSAA